MGEWCMNNLRDCKAWKDEGLEISTTSNECAKFFDATLRQLVSWLDCRQLGGIDATKKKMLAADPDSVVGRCLALGMHALGTSNSVHKEKKFKADLDRLIDDAKDANKREQHHAKAVYDFAYGNMQSACVEWEKILAEHPNDLMALKFAHDGYFFLGDCHRKKNSVKRVIGKWKKTEPCFSYLHGMLAFGLEECGEYVEAEKQARVALEMQRQDCWASHAIAHCCEMNGRFDEGIDFMESTVQDWEPCHILACHNFWHTALFYVEKGDFESALTIYDEQIERRCMSNAMLDIVDAASMLTRLELEHVNVGDRWKSLQPLAESHFEDHVLTFNDCHISMIASKLDDKELLEKHEESLQQFIRNGSGDNHRIAKDIGDQLCEGIVAFNDGNYSKTFELLFPIRFEIVQIGGSHAQRDVFALILFHAAILSPEHKKYAKQLLEERNSIKQNSVLAQRLISQHRDIF